MKFNISYISIKDTVAGFRWHIEGFSQDDNRTIFRTSIHHGKLDEMVIPNYKFNEGDALVVVDKNNAYNINHEMYESEDAWRSMKKENNVSDDNVNPFNRGYYMNLPVVVYCMWRGMLNTDL
jgi:hypothetical protein